MVACVVCSRENPADARFCNGCGAVVAAVPGDRREERKIVTVLFADLVGFTSRAERMDPEDVRAMLAPYWERLRAELERFGGTVEKFIGDAVMALFGAPAAHEDDPERAVRAALAIRDWVRETGEDLQVRIAVNTGEALVLLGARPGEGEGMAAGDVVNTAARLQSAAPVNGVLVGESTFRATRSRIDYAEAEPVTAKGKADPVPVWEAIGARSRPTIETMSRAPLMGRHHELDLLVGALQRVRRERQPQLVTVAGVPGIGKSRLVAELFSVAEADPEFITWRRGRSLSYGDNVSLWALGEIVKAELGVLESDSRAETAAKLAASLAELVGDPVEAAWTEQHLAPLVGLSGDDVDRSQSAAAWRRWIEALADRYPLVLVFEDLQWADDELLDFVDQLVEWVAGVPLLVLCTTRPELFERRPGWGGGKRNALTVSLGPLGDADTARIVAATLDQALLPAETQAALLERADGNPLYAEQYARMVAEGAPPDALPENVQGIVAARLDLLSTEEKSLLQDAGVIGRVFWPSALGAAEDRLHSLVRKEFVRRERRSSIAGEAEYSFAHALVRDVAYAQIPRGARAERHRRAAEWVESLPADRAVDRAEMLAHHYAAAIGLSTAAGADASGLLEPARLAYRDAGHRAFSLNALPAAARFYTAALELWPPDDPERAALLLARAEALMLVGGDAVADAEEALGVIDGDPEAIAGAETILARAYWLRGRGIDAGVHAERALELVSGRPPSRTKATVIVQRARFSMLAGDRERAVELATEGLELSESLQIEHLQASALITRGAARGKDAAALADITRGVEIAEASKSIDELYRGLNNLAEHHFHLGDLSRPNEIHGQIRSLAGQNGHAAQLRWVDGQEVVHTFVLGDWNRSLAIANAMIEAEASEQAHYLSLNAYEMRAYIGHARGEPQAMTDSERAVEYGRHIADAQALGPALSGRVRLLALEGDRAGARELLQEVIAVFTANPSGPFTSAPPCVCAFALVGEPGEYLALLEREPRTPWTEAARATCERDFVTAAEIYAGMGAVTDAAEARVFAAEVLLERGDRAGSAQQLAHAIAFYRSVGATRLIQDAEKLLAATA
jgi:class 3 adenylate cyclase/tetratricopeptide (TPR) repeat protein